MFMVQEGGRTPAKEHLRRSGMDGARIKRMPRRYWRSKCRCRIPDPHTLGGRLTLVYDFFKDLIDPATGRLFFIGDHSKRFKHEMTYVRRGVLNELPGVDLYFDYKKLKKTGLQLFFCVRVVPA